MSPEFLIIDLFCGAGGTTTGFEMTDGVARVIACVNHDPKAIKSHWRNHPHVKHFEEDIRTLKLNPLVKLAREWQAKHPSAKLILWASLECTNFSKAKGGQPRDADSRTLAEHLHRYIKALHPDAVMIENVVEFMSWGPLDENGKPVSRKSGSDWMRWRGEVCAHGYFDDWAELNSADFGARTSRNRLFGMFARTREEICWPEPTHCKKPSAGSMFSGLKKWEPCRPCLDLEDQGTSIFTPGKIKSPKTWERVLAGCIRFIACMGYKEFISKYYSGNDWNRNFPVSDPAGVVTTSNRMALIQTEFLSKTYSGRPEGKNIPIDGPAGTITTFGSHAIVQSEFLVQRNGGEPSAKILPTDGPARTITSTGGNQDLVQPEFLLKYNSTDGKTAQGSNASIEDPSPVIPTQRIPNLVQTEFLSHYYGTSGHHSSIDDPAPTIPTKDRTAKVKAEWLDKGYSNPYNHQSVDQPAGALTGSDKYALMQPEHIILSTNFDNKGQSVDQPLGTITANRKWHYLMNPQYQPGKGSSIDDPCFTLIARMDKAPPYLVHTESGEVAIEVYETDIEPVRKLKYFMAMYGIVDIKMRMLKVNELKKIQGFPDNYILEGTQADQKKFIGNSVVPHVVKSWTLALAERKLRMAV